MNFVYDVDFVLADGGRKPILSVSSLIWSTELLDAASISRISKLELDASSTQFSHFPQGEPSARGERQLTALAKIFATEVLPVPLVPVKMYACPILPCAI